MIAKQIQDFLGCSPEEAEMILGKAIIGGEINDDFNESDWFKNRFQPNVVFIDEEGYTRMCVDALKILGLTAATDYGSSRQRDMGQLWADMTRGYLGEHAFQMFLQQRLGIQAVLDHEKGQLQDFLPMDIHGVREPNGEYRAPRIRISIKTTKWNGIWLDIPGDQFNHSQIHVLVKVGTGRDHLFAFFKHISVFRDKVLMKGQSVGAITEKESNEIFDNLPNFKPVAAYICGFVKEDAQYNPLSYAGKLGRRNFTITSWNGPIEPGDLQKIKEHKEVPGKVTFQGIGDFAHDRGYLFNTGKLLWKPADWDYVKQRI